MPHSQGLVTTSSLCSLTLSQALTTLTITLPKSVLSKYFKLSRSHHEFKEGDVAPLAHTEVRKFPDWYKPYRLNYTSDGYMFAFFGLFALFGYSYMNDIKE